MPAVPTFNALIVAKLREAILKNPVAQSVTIDGVTTSMVDVQARLNFYEGELSREQGRDRFNGFNLGGFQP